MQGRIVVMVMRQRLQVNELMRQPLHGRLLRSWNNPGPRKGDEHQGEQVAANR